MALIGGPETYEPHFNIETGEYEDESPFQSYDRVNNKIYMCQCIKKNIHNMSQFKLHIKNKGHLHWLRNYQGLHTHADHAKLSTNYRISKAKNLLKSNQIEELQNQLSISQRRYRMRTKQVEEQKRQIEILQTYSTIYNPEQHTMNSAGLQSEFTDDDADSIEVNDYGSLD